MKIEIESYFLVMMDICEIYIMYQTEHKHILSFEITVTVLNIIITLNLIYEKNDVFTLNISR